MPTQIQNTSMCSAYMDCSKRDADRQVVAVRGVRGIRGCRFDQARGGERSRKKAQRPQESPPPINAAAPRNTNGRRLPW